MILLCYCQKIFIGERIRGVETGARLAKQGSLYI